MVELEELAVGVHLNGVLPGQVVQVIAIEEYGPDCRAITHRLQNGTINQLIVYRGETGDFSIAVQDAPWSFDGDGATFRLVSEAHRIRLAHLFDPVLAVHTSLVDPLPHQITAVYEAMLPRQPLRFLLADDPGAGKTIMAGLLIKELIIRGDIQRCLVVCPGSLVEQWQDELYRRFNLPFSIMTNDGLQAARTGNWVVENNLVIARLDKLSRDESLQEKLKVPEAFWDLVICDEAHKMSASYFGNEAKYTKRYQLGELLSGITRHFLLMTATPHNGKEEDFQLFLRLLDSDRFEGKYRKAAHIQDVSDLMRRMVKENLLKFDGTPLFPERIAHTVPFKLTGPEAQLYESVTEYVRTEFNRAQKVGPSGRAGTVGFALTVLQRRLASSPEAIYRSITRRRERLEKWMRELRTLQRDGVARTLEDAVSPMSDDDIEEMEDAPDAEVEETENEVIDLATAARSIEELKAEIETLKGLEHLAYQVRNSGTDAKWSELSSLLSMIFTPGAIVDAAADPEEGYAAGDKPSFESSPKQKLVIFTEHRDTLSYLHSRIVRLLGREDAIVMIHGGMGREERLKAQDAFKFHPDVQILLATDAAGEGINLQRAHLMVNYDLPWNPNRLEQRFGRIHRIGQTEVCHLWNLVADETREGDVYKRLLEKLEQARQSLGGQVFDVLGKLQFEGKSLRDLLIEAIRYGDDPVIRAKLTTVIEQIDREKFADLLDDNALARDSMDSSRVASVRENMERAQARRLQPHFIEAFFLEAFQRTGGKVRQRETRRYEVTNVPPTVRQQARQGKWSEHVQSKYERIAFEKGLITTEGKPMAAFICPGHPLLDATIDLTLLANRNLLRQGAVLVDDRDQGNQPRMLFYLEHSIQDASQMPDGSNRTVSKRMLYVEVTKDGDVHSLRYAPYLDYRPLSDGDPSIDLILSSDDARWVNKAVEQHVLNYAIASVVPSHRKEVIEDRLSYITKTRKAVQDRLTKEINYWDHRAEELKHREAAGDRGARLNSGEARKRADSLQARLAFRLEQLDNEAKLSARMPLVLGGALIVPAGMLDKLQGRTTLPVHPPKDTQAAAAAARDIVMDIERSLGHEPIDREFEKLGYDIESKEGATGKLRFIEVKGRIESAKTLTVTKNEILYSLNNPEQFILAIVEFVAGGQHRVHYVRQPFKNEPDFGAASVNYDMADLINRGTPPG